jgi:hypothetical protein
MRVYMYVTVYIHTYSHDLEEEWLKERGVSGFDTGFIGHLQLLLTFHSGALAISKLLSTVHYILTESSWTAVSHLSSGTGFQRRILELSPRHSHSDS